MSPDPDQPSVTTTPEPPYYAVIFTSQLTDDADGYAEMAERMVALAARQEGFLGMETARGTDGLGITVSYWRDEAAISIWKQQLDHQEAQRLGAQHWYRHYQVRVAKVERAYALPEPAGHSTREAGTIPTP